MQNYISVTESEIEKIKNEFEFYINKLSEISSILNNEMEASLVLLSAARINIDNINDKFKVDFPLAAELYKNLSTQVKDFEDEIAAHIIAAKK
nr:hypothetical protein GTC16762_32580 [Pigmentibacter ruber]